MENCRALLHVIMRTGGSDGGAHRIGWLRQARNQAIRQILVPALVLVSFGATAAASPSHSINDSVVRLTAQHSVYSPMRLMHAHSIKRCKMTGRHAINSTILKMPWMYTTTNNRMPWMYTTTNNRMPWTYATPYRMPWMYGSNGSPQIMMTCLPASIRAMLIAFIVNGRTFHM